MGERAAQIAAGQLVPATARDAATVALLRPASVGPEPPADGGRADDVEVYLLRRAGVLEFAPGACVFPGGSVDHADADASIGWFGPSAADVGALLGVPADRCRALICAAVRETFEECGVLLASPAPSGPALPDAQTLLADRVALLAGAVSLRELLHRRGLVLRADLLTPWARWITPEASPRRFDTWFFAAALPDGQQATAGSAALPSDTEADSGAWIQPGAALAAARSGEISLLPPTAVTLAELAAHRDLAVILAQRRTIEPLMPGVVLDEGQAWLALPDTVDYPL